jgi:hypothetical protein
MGKFHEASDSEFWEVYAAFALSIFLNSTGWCRFSVLECQIITTEITEM